MNIGRFTVLAFCALISASVFAGSGKPKKVKVSKDEFINGLMGKMTLDEKIGQLVLPDGHEANTGVSDKTDIYGDIKKGLVGSVLNVSDPKAIRELQRVAVNESRLKIPLLVGLDVIHGFRTIFPIPLAQSCSWDTALVRKAARIAAIEASAYGVNWNYSPMVDVAHDGRWGRIAEGNGEDPFLSACIAKSLVYGYQEDMKKNTDVAACLKHYALYGAVESGLDYNFVDMSRVRMFNEYMLPYQAAVEAGVRSVMSSFNVIDFMPASGNKWLLDDVLRKKWGFKGFTVTDYNGIGEMTSHGIDGQERCAELAAKAGIDIDMCSQAYLKHLKDLVKSGKVSMETVNTLCRRVLEAKWELGLFEDANRGHSEKEVETAVRKKEYFDIARQLAGESIVLLKNDGNVLPLKKQGKIAVIGPLAKAGRNLYGCWTGNGSSQPNLSIYEAIKEAVGNNGEVTYARGSNVFANPDYEAAGQIKNFDVGRDSRSAEEMVNEAVNVAKNSDVVIATLGELADMTGESQSRADLEMPDVQRELYKALLKTGKPVVLLYITGRPVAMRWEKANAPVIVETWFGGTEAAHAIADVVFGDRNPSGKLTTTFPQITGQLPFTYARYRSGRPVDPNAKFVKYAQNYMDVTMAPAYPFGYGMSYTTYKYGELTLSANSMDKDGKVTASLTVSNTGNRAGDEVVQLYIHDIAASVIRPVKELKGFKRVHLEAGETKKVEFEITEPMLKFYNADLQFASEPGDFDIMVGPNSSDVQTKKLTLN